MGGGIGTGSAGATKEDFTTIDDMVKLSSSFYCYTKKL